MGIPHEPMYGWALTPEGIPVPIALAQRGQRYVCPVCKSEMVAKMGDVKQHHFAHLNLLECTPDNVARAVAGKWLAQTLSHFLASGRPVFMEWKAQSEVYKVDLLKDVGVVVETHLTPNGTADIALLNEKKAVKVAFLLGLGKAPDQAQLHDWTKSGTAVIALNPSGVRSGQMSLETLLAASEIYGGWWLLDAKEFPSTANVVRDPSTLRRYLRRVVKVPPYRFYSELTSEGALTHLLKIEGQQLWLPPEVWRDVVGGSRNRLGQDVEVTLQNWETQDKGHIALFYIMVRNTTAIAVRRFLPGEAMSFALGNSAFRLTHTTALDLAQHLVGGPISFPT